MHEKYIAFNTSSINELLTFKCYTGMCFITSRHHGHMRDCTGVLDGNSLHNVIVSWKYKSLLYVVFWLIFKSYLKCTTSSYQMSSRRHAFQTCICSLIGFNSYFVLYLMSCFGNNPLYMDFKPIKIPFCSVLNVYVVQVDWLLCRC